MSPKMMKEAMIAAAKLPLSHGRDAGKGCGRWLRKGQKGSVSALAQPLASSTLRYIRVGVQSKD